MRMERAVAMAGLREALCWALHTSRRKLEAGLGWPGPSAWGCVSAACTEGLSAGLGGCLLCSLQNW